MIELGANFRFDYDIVTYTLFTTYHWNIIKYLINIDGDIINVVNKIDYNNRFKSYLEDEDHFSFCQIHYDYYTDNDCVQYLNSCDPVYYPGKRTKILLS